MLCVGLRHLYIPPPTLVWPAQEGIFTLLINGGRTADTADWSLNWWYTVWWKSRPLVLFVSSSAFCAAAVVNHSLPFPSFRSPWPLLVPLEPPPEESLMLTAGLMDSCRCPDLSMVLGKRPRCAMNCQFKLHLLLQTPLVWNVADLEVGQLQLPNHYSEDLAR